MTRACGSELLTAVHVNNMGKQTWFQSIDKHCTLGEVSLTTWIAISNYTHQSSPRTNYPSQQ